MEHLFSEIHSVIKLGITLILQLLVGFTLSEATKALRESRGIALLYFRPLH